jgi:hypothetical protein
MEPVAVILGTMFKMMRVLKQLLTVEQDITMMAKIIVLLVVKIAMNAVLSPVLAQLVQEIILLAQQTLRFAMTVV